MPSAAQCKADYLAACRSADDQLDQGTITVPQHKAMIDAAYATWQACAPGNP